MHSYAIRLKFNTSDHAIDCEALLAGLITFVSKCMKDLHVFIDSLTLVAQIEGNHTPATEHERKYKEEIMDATTLFYSLKKRVKKLKQKRKSRTLGLKRLRKVGTAIRVESLTKASLGDQEDASKQGRMIDNINQDVEITLVDDIQGRMSEEDMFKVNDLDGMDRHNAIFVISSHTKKVFANIKMEGKDFSRKATPLFATMRIQAPEDMGEAINHLSKWVEAKALLTNDPRVFYKFLKSLFARFGTPRAIITDREMHFYNDQFVKVMLKYSVTYRLATPYHSQTSGQVEKLLKDLKKLAEYDQSTKVPEEQKQNMEKAMFDLVKICHHKQFLCIHDDIDNLIEIALDSKLLSINSINSQRLDKKEKEVKIVEEQPAERRNRIEKSLQNFRVIHKSSISLNTSQISLIHSIGPILSTKEPEHSLSMGYEHLSITPETESDEVTEPNAKNLLPIPSECEVTLEDKRECDELICENSSTVDVCDNHSETFFDSKINDDISVYDDDFEDIEYVDASLPNPEIVSIEEENGVEEENVIQREEEEVDLEDISQVQDVVLRKKLFRITRLISNIEFLNDNSTPDRVLNSFESDNSLLDNYSPEFETFCDNSEETRSEEADLFLSDNSIPPGIENVADDLEGDVRFLEELLIDDSILSHESSDSNFEDNPSIPRPPLEPPDDNFDLEPEVISAVMEDINEANEHFNPGGEIFVSKNNEDVDYFPFMFVIRIFLPYLILPEISPLFLSAESEDTIFDPGFSE
nr:reverse transcriptase domain-containing protein [Tanacetum cinerariifolium]